MNNEELQEVPTATEQSLNMQRCYLKSLSVELPNAPGIFLENGAIAMDLSMTLSSQLLAVGIIEVSVRGTLTAKLGEKIVYLVEAEQAGVFEMISTTAQEAEQVINVLAPTILYPYLRGVVADAIARTGLPIFHLPEVNFSAMAAAASQKATLSAPAGITV